MVNRHILLYMFILYSFSTFAQTDSMFCRKSYPHKKRIVLVTSGTCIASVGSLTALAGAWYQDDRSSFRFFNDMDEWKQMDKAGHLATTYNVALILADLYRWAGVNDRKSRIIASSVSFGYMTTIEVLDGFSKGYGFSHGDMLFNFLGSGAALFNNDKQRYYPSVKYSYHNTSFASVNPGLLGKSQAERMLKDYNGQTYWISVPGIIKHASWLCVSLGYGATGMVRARDAQNVSLGLNPERSYLLSLDVDLTKIKTESCALKGLCSVFRFIRIPFPAVELNRQGMTFHPFYF